MEELYTFISATFGVATAVTLVIVGLAFWLTHYITKKVTIINNDHSEFKQTTTGIVSALDKIKEEVIAIKAEQSSIHRTLERQEGSLADFGKEMAYVKGSLDIVKSGSPTLMQSHSPISLTEDGWKVVEELKGNDIVDRNWGKIKEVLEPMKEHTAYAIQEFCIETASVESEKFFSEADIRCVETFAFQKGYPVALYFRVLGLLIRDRYFAENGVPLSRIDETCPQ